MKRVIYMKKLTKIQEKIDTALNKLTVYRDTFVNNREFAAVKITVGDTTFQMTFNEYKQKIEVTKNAAPFLSFAATLENLVKFVDTFPAVIKNAIGIKQLTIKNTIFTANINEKKTVKTIHPAKISRTRRVG